MLNLKDIAARIERPELRSSEDIQSLQELIHKYPYAQIFPLLYLNQLAKNNSVHFEEELQKYAYRITDREVLYQLIHSAPETSAPKEEEKVTVEIIEEEVQNLSEKNDETTSSTQLEVTEMTNEISEETLPPVEDTVEEEEITIEENTATNEVLEDEKPLESIAEKPQDEIIEQESIAQSDTYEKELLAQTLAASYSLEVEEDEKPSDNLDDLIHDIQHKKENSESNLKVEEEIIEAQKEIQPSEFKVPVSLDAKLSFSSWLRSDSHYFENHPEEKTTESQPVKDIEQLFEGRKEKKEFFSPTKKAKESLDENRVPVSETLAKIFIMQGNYPKAIYAYEQLMLIIPEKKSFFANQIKELKKKLNS